jgi:hypothetical protein
MKDVLPCTTAVIFMACPHRATEHAKLVDAVKSMASVTLKVPATDHVLQELTGANGFELELGRESFVRLWNDYNFRVKTFQEKVPMKPKTADNVAELVSLACFAFLRRIEANRLRHCGKKRASLATRESRPRFSTRTTSTYVNFDP